MSSLPTPDEFWLAELDEERRANRIKIEYATVIQLTLQGEPIIQFPRETLPSKKTYRRLKNYSPQPGDRVVLINDVIIGGFRP